MDTQRLRKIIAGFALRPGERRQESRMRETFRRKCSYFDESADLRDSRVRVYVW